jgi:hypothetical protein
MTADVAELRALTSELAHLAAELDDGRSRIELDPEDVSRGLAQLVLTVVELLRQLMERQAIRRMDSGSLTDDQVERLGTTFMRLEERMTELKQHFRLRDGDLNLDLGPLGKLL